MLASAIQLAGAPLPTMLIGTLPVVIAVCSNWLPGHPSDDVAWRRLAPSLLIILAGLLLVNAGELARTAPVAASRMPADYAIGCPAGASAAVAAWTWYPMRERAPHEGPSADRLDDLGHRAGPGDPAAGLARLLPLRRLAGVERPPSRSRSDRGRMRFIGLMLAVGLTASWLGTLLWNQASQRLPTSLAGQLIVFETLFALLYAFILRGAVPETQVLLGVVLLCVGVTLGIRAFRPA